VRDQLLEGAERLLRPPPARVSGRARARGLRRRRARLGGALRGPGGAAPGEGGLAYRPATLVGANASRRSFWSIAASSDSCEKSTTPEAPSARAERMLAT